jgi:hypothetical protein
MTGAQKDLTIRFLKEAWPEVREATENRLLREIRDTVPGQQNEREEIYRLLRLLGKLAETMRTTVR